MKVDFIHILHIVQDVVHQFLSTMDIERLYKAVVYNLLPTTPTYKRRVLNLLSRVETGIVYFNKRWKRMQDNDKLESVHSMMRKVKELDTGAIGIFEWFIAEFG